MRRLGRAIAAEFFGTGALLAVVVGSGIMAERLSAGNLGVALLANALVTGFGVYVLITLCAPVYRRDDIVRSRHGMSASGPEAVICATDSSGSPFLGRRRFPADQGAERPGPVDCDTRSRPRLKAGAVGIV